MRYYRIPLMILLFSVLLAGTPPSDSDSQSKTIEELKSQVEKLERETNKLKEEIRTLKILVRALKQQVNAILREGVFKPSKSVKPKNKSTDQQKSEAKTKSKKVKIKLILIDRQFYLKTPLTIQAVSSTRTRVAGEVYCKTFLKYRYARFSLSVYNKDGGLLDTSSFTIRDIQHKDSKGFSCWLNCKKDDIARYVVKLEDAVLR